MKKIFAYSLLLAFIFTSCGKNKDSINIDWDKYPTDQHAPNSELDNWIIQNFNIPWNIEVMYRFDRNYGDQNRNIGPIDLDKVKPSLEMVVNGFTQPYTKLLGASFGKVYFPKLWVLYGTPSYNSDASYTLGSMSNARVLTLYDLNNLSNDNIRRRLRTVHHEFMHSLNQTVPIPLAYQGVSGADYDPSWTGKSDDDVRPLGFVSPYASSAYTEDFAEMLAHIVVEGPMWYSNYLFFADEEGFNRLKEKEDMVYSYLLNNFNLDMYELQAEVQNQLKTIYNIQEPVDVDGFPARLLNNKVNSIDFNPEAGYLIDYGISGEFETLWNNYVARVTGLGRFPYDMSILFNDVDEMTLSVGYRNASGSAYRANYDFTFTVDEETGLTVFTKKTPEGTSGSHGNGTTAALLPGFTEYLLPYFTNNQFIAEYMPRSISKEDPNYKSFAGFSVVGAPDNYFYGMGNYK